jgi:hypothetical protein
MYRPDRKTGSAKTAKGRPPLSSLVRFRGLEANEPGKQRIKALPIARVQLDPADPTSL